MKLLNRLLVASALALTCCHNPQSKLNPPVDGALVAGAPTASMAQPPVLPPLVTQDSQRFDRGTFTINIPHDWIVEDTRIIENAGPEVKLVARSGADVGAGRIVVTVEILNIEDDMPDEVFGEAVLAMLKMNDVRTIVQGRAPIDDKPGSIAVLLLDGNVSVVQYAVGYNKNGYLVRCAGDVRAARQVAPACKKVLDTFHTI